MKAAVFVRYHSGDGAGHVGWAFDAGGGCSIAGSVENHSGHLFTPASEMGYWEERIDDPVRPMRERSYDDVKIVHVRSAKPVAAYRTMLWIKHEAYHVIRRNCEDDAYDVLRAYGATQLPAPLMHWLPSGWFESMRGEKRAVAHARWHTDANVPELLPRHFQSLQPWCPTWRRRWHPHFHFLNVLKVLAAVRRLYGGAGG